MKINEVLNLYKFSANPDELPGYEQSKMPATNGGRRDRVKIQISKHRSIDMEFNAPSIDVETPTKLALAINKPKGTRTVERGIYDPKDFNWIKHGLHVQRSHYIDLCKVLARHGLTFDKMWYVKKIGGNRKGPFVLNGFVMISGPQEHPNFVWYRYVGSDPQQSQNVIYPRFGETKRPVTYFLQYPVQKQDLLIDPTATKYQAEISMWETPSHLKNFKFTLDAPNSNAAHRNALKHIKAHPDEFPGVTISPNGANLMNGMLQIMPIR